MRRLNKVGDTIVEVLLAMFFLGVLLAAAYISSNQSTNANRDSQERADGLKYAESQLELIRANYAALATKNGYYCLDSSGTVVDFGAFSPTNNLYNDDFTGYPAACSVGLIPGGYHISVKQTSLTYTVKVRWDKVSNGRDEIHILYRPPQP